MGVGWLLRRFGALGDEGVRALTSVVYWAASPALLFHAVSEADMATVVGAPLAVAAICGIGSALVFSLISVPALRPSRGDLVLGAMSASLNNAAYIGIPIAVYVLGDASRVVPVIVFQLGFFTPMFFVLADLAGSGRKPTLRGVLATVYSNPMVIAAALGFACSAVQAPIPEAIATTASMLGQAAPPLILIAFGASLVGSGAPLVTANAAAVALASTCKLAVQPLIALGAGFLIGLRGPELMTVTVMAGMPTAQNAFIAATRARTGERIAQGAVIITTLAALPLTILTAWLFTLTGSI